MLFDRCFCDDPKLQNYTVQQGTKIPQNTSAWLVREERSEDWQLPDGVETNGVMWKYVQSVKHSAYVKHMTIPPNQLSCDNMCNMWTTHGNIIQHVATRSHFTCSLFSLKQHKRSHMSVLSYSTCLFVSLSLSPSLFLSLSLCIYIYILLYMCVYTYVYITYYTIVYYVYIYIYIYVYIYIYIHTYT